MCTKGGYQFVHINLAATSTRKAFNKTLPLYKLVCCTFNGPPSTANEIYIDHVNQNKLDNTYTNLRLVDSSTNNLNRTLNSSNTAPQIREKQEWRVVGDYQDFKGNKFNFSKYEISIIAHLRGHGGDILFDRVDSHGYITNDLTCADSGNTLSVYRHRLVAYAFKKHEMTEEQNFVDHINGIKTDNRAINLRYASNQENSAYSQGQQIQLILNDIIIHESSTIKDFVAKYKGQFSDLAAKITKLSSFNATSKNDNKEYTIKRISEKFARN